MLETIGWIGSICFAVCSFPQAYTCYKQGHGRGLSTSFMCIWLAGEIFTIPYMYMTHGWDWPIMTNLISNTTFILFIMRYMFFPRGSNA